MLVTPKVNLEKIILERANQGLSAHELSLKAGLSKNVVSNMERGYVVPRLHTVGKIVNALGKRIEDFI
ncbi:helix-turn-helix transcriptional regulator [Lysinibacillus sp. FSL M8-0216]|uniref:helix-turn-helix domain-containing protein n=1 Tax=Lysinibacillus sp. FSL M8-0216 TaxID=2921619 RepID=UPI00315B2655